MKAVKSSSASAKNAHNIKSSLVVSVLLRNCTLPRGCYAWMNPDGRVFYQDGRTGLFTWTKPK